MKPVVPPPEGPAVPVAVVTPGQGSADGDIKRLTRIILSDIVIYSPEKAEKAILEGRFLEMYRHEIEEGRKMIRTRFAGTSGAVGLFDQALADLLDTRRKELLDSAFAL